MSRASSAVWGVVPWVVVASLAAGLAVAGPGFPPPPTHRVPSTAEAVTVDAVLDEPAWATALALELPTEIDPGENVPAPVRTTCLLTHDRAHLYVAFRAYDPDPKAIRAHLTDRDRPYRDDFVGIMLDTFNDRRRGYELFVNPLGVQMDLSRNEIGGDSEEDETWDAIWSSAGRITAEGYVVEMAVPFSALRFPRVDGPQTWRVAPFRAYPRSVRHQLFAVPLDQGNNCFFCQVPEIVGFEGIEPSRSIELDPTLTAERTDALEDEDDLGSRFVDGSVDIEAGLSARWGVTPNVSLNAAVNPDFSQVEADAAQLATNTRYALFFAEKRPLFLEGADIFGTQVNAVHTRTVADPRWGVKVSGKEGRQAFGAFVARDRTTNLLFPSNQGTELDTLEEENTSGVVRYRHDLGESSALGFLATAREGDSYHNRVAGVDGSIRFTQKDTLRFQLLGSRTRYPAAIAEAHGQPRGELDGSAVGVSYGHDTRQWHSWAWVDRYSRGFRADLGFVPRVDTQTAGVGAERVWRGTPGSWYSKLAVGVEPSRTEDTAGTLTDQAFHVFGTYTGPLQSTVRVTMGRARERYEGVTYDLDKLVVFVNVRPTGDFTCSLDTRFGDAVDYDNGRPATVTRLAPGITWDLGRQLYLQVDHIFEDLDVAKGRLYRANLSQVKLIYQLNLRSFVRAIVQRLDLRRDASLYLDAPTSAKEGDLFAQLMFSYKLNPQTVLFVGYADNRGSDDRLDLVRKSRTFFAKVGYAWLL